MLSCDEIDNVPLWSVRSRSDADIGSHLVDRWLSRSLPCNVISFLFVISKYLGAIPLCFAHLFLVVLRCRPTDVSIPWWVLLQPALLRSVSDDDDPFLAGARTSSATQLVCAEGAALAPLSVCYSRYLLVSVWARGCLVYSVGYNLK